MKLNDAAIQELLCFKSLNDGLCSYKAHQACASNCCCTCFIVILWYIMKLKTKDHMIIPLNLLMLNSYALWLFSDMATFQY